jgi:lipopolysaccharide export system protein LptC
MTPRPARPFSLLRSPCSGLRLAGRVRRAALLALLVAPCSLLLLPAANAPTATPTIVKNFSLRRFTKEGDRRDTDLRADEARYFTRSELTLTGATYTLYTHDAANRPETVFTAPTATALPDEKILRGEQSVRVVRDDFEVSGEQWSYDHNAQTLTIGNNARTVINAALPDLIR